MSTGAEPTEEGVPPEGAEGLAGPRCQVFAWGNCHGVSIRDGKAKAVPTDADLFEEAGLNTAAQLKLSLGEYTAFAVTATGQAYSWGSTKMRGQAADEALDRLPRLLISLSSRHVEKIAAGSRHALSIVRGGAVYSWGHQEESCTPLGHGDAHPTGEPRLIQSFVGTPIKDVAAGRDWSMALSEEGRVYTWGQAVQALGHGKPVQALNVPKMIEKRESSRVMEGVIRIYAGPNNAACCTESETLVWGICTSGELGNGGTEERNPTPLPLEIPEYAIAQVAFGGQHGAALTECGAVFTWGSGSNGQLGHGDTSPQHAPKQVMALRAIKCSAVACGGTSTFVLTEDGSTYSWGDASNNILGHGDSQQLTIPREIISLRPTRSMLVDSIVPCTYSTYAFACTRTVPAVSVPKSTLIDELAASLNNPELSDTKIVVESREIHVSSFILRTRCKHFQIAHSESWSETERSGPITIPLDTGIKYETVMRLMRYLYTDQIEVGTHDAIELIALADFYQLPRLRALVEDFVVQHIHVDDVAAVFEAATDYHAENLAAQCQSFMVENFAAVALTDGFAALPKHLMTAIVRAAAERL